MDNCPLVRPLGRIVEEEKRPFIWMPGSQPFFGLNPDSVQVTASSIISATRVEDGVPIFSAKFTTTSSYALAAGSPADPDAPGPAREIEDDVIASDAASEDDAEEPVNRYRRLAIEAQSLEHRMCHLPKNRVPYVNVQECTESL